MVATADILLHPIRLRIVLALAGRERTTQAIRADLDDVAPATLYRQVNRLIESGIVEVIEERQVRGGVERTLALVEGAASLGPTDIVDVSPAQLLDYFVRVMTGLIGEFGRYVEQPDADPVADRVGFRQVPVWLDDDEFDGFAARMGELIAAAHANAPEGRRRRLLTTVVLPSP